MLAVIAALLIAGGAFAFVAVRSEPPRLPQPAIGLRADSRYVDPTGFSLEVPEGYSARVVQDEVSRAVVFERGGSGFQIAVSPYDEPADGFGAERVKRDLPDLDMRDVRGIEVAGGKGISFLSDSLYEAWFIVDGSLYQITAPPAEAANAERAVATFNIE